MPLALLPCVLSLAAAPAPQLLGDTLLADINAGPAIVHGFGEGVASSGTLAFFQGSDASSGQNYRLWRSDGTAAGTTQLAPEALLVLEATALPGGGLFFTADELGSGVAVWRTDGTPAGTVRVLGPSVWTVVPHDLTVFAGAVWFLAAAEGSGVEVWRSDLATGATVSLPGPASGSTHLFEGGGKLFAADTAQGELLASNGASIEVVAHFAQASADSFTHVAQAGARVLFNLGGFGPDAGWWISDGTAPGTFKLAGTLNDFWAVSGSTKAYFTTGSIASTPLLWETDGTPTGTLPVDLPTSTGGQRVSLDAGIAVGDELFYSGLVPGAGFELCRTGGAAGGAAPMADIKPGSQDSSPDDFVTFGGAVLFRAEDGVHGREIWRADPASGAVALVADLYPGPFAGIVGSEPTLFPAQGAVVFGQNFADAGIELGFTDGVQSGLLIDIGDDGLSDGSGPNGFLRLGGKVVFQALEETTGAELWISDGTQAGTELLADIDPSPTDPLGGQGSFPHHFVAFGERAFFNAGHPSFGNELWSTDGTTAGTGLVVDLIPGPGSSEPLFSTAPVALDDALYLIAREPDNDFGLFRTDGTAAGTTLVVTTDASGFFTEFTRLERVNDRLLFLGFNSLGVELWTSDGTAGGTSPLADMTPGSGNSFVQEIAVGETQAFVTVSSDGAQSLWVTNGLPGGTSKIFDSSTGPGFVPSDLATLGDRLLFRAFTPDVGGEPWTSDGTAAGTHLLLDIAPGPLSSNALAFTAAGDRAFFVSAEPAGSLQFANLWITDGTATGTALVAHLPSPPDGAAISDLWHPGSDRTLLFTSVDASGEEWWVSDGTAAGTLPLTDSAPGPQFASPSPGVLLKNRLLFAASDGENGVELHSLPLSATGAWAATALGAGCAGASGTPELSLASDSVQVGASLAVALDHAAPGGIALWAFDGAYGGLPPFGTCAIQLPAPKLLASTPVGPAGHSSLSASLPPAPSLAGLALDLQALALEPGGPFLGVGTLTAVLELVVGP